jgi:general nucleoside transport system ATP-binding protein
MGATAAAPTPEAGASRVELRAITRRYPGVLANDRVDLVLQPGEVHALVGENGAGKSTLVKILSGIERPDAGEVRIDGVVRHFKNPQQAIASGIGTVHQHFMLFPSLTVAENVVFGQEPARRGLVDLDAAVRHVDRLAREHGLVVDPRARVGELPVGLQQRVEILKALARGARVLILDEPTAVLTPAEVDELFPQICQVAQTGTAVLVVTHKMREVMEISNRITVVRYGKVTGTLETARTSPREIIRLMVGREVLEQLDRHEVEPGRPLLAVEEATILRGKGIRAVDGVSLAVRAGQILGVAGVAGNGQSELIEGIVGLRPLAEGRILLGDRELAGLAPRGRRALGLAYIPEDRNREGVAGEATIEENMAMGAHDRPPLARRGLLSYPALAERTTRLVGRFDVRTPDTKVRVQALSGGNVQKVVIARELAAQPQVLIAAEPTRGLDVGAIEFVHQQLLNQRDAGVAILLISSELSEIEALADRAVVMFGGRLVGEFDPRRTSREAVGAMMAGAV